MVDNVCLHQARVEAVNREAKHKKGEQASQEASSQDYRHTEAEDDEDLSVDAQQLK